MDYMYHATFIFNGVGLGIIVGTTISWAVFAFKDFGFVRENWEYFLGLYLAGISFILLSILLAKNL